jgi:hypothetical protein
MYLVFWMKLSVASTLLAVQLSSPLACEAQRQEYKQDIAQVDDAQCVRGDDALLRLIEKHDCAVMEGRDTFANYVCSKPL